MVIIPVLLYIPAVQTFVCDKAVSYLNSANDQMNFSVGKIRIGFPLRLKVYDLGATVKNDTTILFSLGKLETSLDAIPLGKDYFLVKRFKADDIRLGFDTLTQSVLLKGFIDHIDISNIYLNLEESKVDVNRIVIDNPDLQVGIGPSVPDTIDDESKFAWTIALNHAFATGGDVRYDLSGKSLDEAVGSVSYTHLRAHET